jgi:aspartate aminotransferase-like enzyme
MGYNARADNVVSVLVALEDVLTDQGYGVPTGAGVAAARASLRQAPAIPA